MSTTLVSGDVSTILFKATTTARAVGDVVVVGGVAVICKVAIAAAATGAAFINGRHKMSKNTGKPFTQGGLVYRESATKVSAVSTSNTRIGRAAKAATTSEADGEFFLNFSAA